MKALTICESPHRLPSRSQLAAILPGLSLSMTRRTFCYRLGSAGLAFISGCFWLNDTAAAHAGAPGGDMPHGELPRVQPDVKTKQYQDWTIVYRTGRERGNVILLNRIGALVLAQLRGRTTVEDILDHICAACRMRREEKQLADIAIFIAQLGCLGLLTHPYYACIYETG